ncbi:LapA family protein [Motiliproteus sp.]|uniref:LapA family protein n=1 Tax=Motiliproteus sp. TaxID=1898955 RepID=UPI003BADA7A6
MRVIKAILIAVAALLLLLLGVLLTVNNQQQIAVDLVFFQFPEASIARWLLLSFFMGVVVSFIVGGITLMALKARLGQARRSATKYERELDKLRTVHLNQPG